MPARKRKPPATAKHPGGRPLGERGSSKAQAVVRLFAEDVARIKRLGALWQLKKRSDVLRRALEMADDMYRSPAAEDVVDAFDGAIALREHEIDGGSVTVDELRRKLKRKKSPSR